VSRYHIAVCVSLILLVAASSRSPALGQDLVIAQSVEQTHRFDLAEVGKLPATELQISFLTGHGQAQASYTGGLLWTLLDRAEAVGGTDPRTRLRRSVTITGRDGYVAVLALAEIDPEFEGKQVILAYKKNGQPLDGGGLQLVVPGDNRGGRSVRDVVRIEVH